MLTVHHLGRSQSERIVWLCEELGLDYELKVYDRDKKTILAPPELKALHPIGSAPIITDGPVTLAESGAIVDYILGRYGQGRLAPPPLDPTFPDYLYWLHFANGTMQPAMGRRLYLSRAGIADDHPVGKAALSRHVKAYEVVESRLAAVPYFAGEKFTAADIMMVTSITTMRLFVPFDLAPYPAILAYLKRIGERPGYRHAMEKGDPGFAPMLGA